MVFVQSENSLTQFISHSFQQKQHKLKSTIADIIFKVVGCAQNSI